MISDFISFEFGKLHYAYEDSSKKSTLLFLHSLNSSAASFAKLCDSLKNEYNCFCLDFPGHGLSDHIDIEKHVWYYSFEGLTKILIDFVDRLELKNIHVIGNSLGGNTAVRAIESLKELRSLMLVGSIQAKEKEQLFNIMYQDAPVDLLFKNKLSQKELELLTTTYVNESNHDHDGFKQMLFDIKRTDGNFREKFGESIEKQVWVDEPSLILNSQIPAQYFLGLEDKFIESVPYKNLLIEMGFAASQIHLIENGSHVPHLNDPQLCAKMISSYVSEICEK